jgi:hypothetical protein
MKKLIIIILAIGSTLLYSQNNNVINALNEELNRNFSNLKIDNLKPLKYIEYALSDGEVYELNVSYGSVITENSKKITKPFAEVIVGEDIRTSENYISQNSLWGFNFFDNVNIEKDPIPLKIHFWNETDNLYKNEAETFENKISTMSQQKIDEIELNLNDFYSSSKQTINIDRPQISIDKNKWKAIIKSMSNVFFKYPEIENSNVYFNVFDTYIYYVNSENTTAQYPITIYSIKVKASTHAEDGEELSDYMLIYSASADNLPDVKTLLSKTEDLAKNLSGLKSATVFNDAYAGPVLFEGQAAAEIFLQVFLKSDNALYAKRKPIIEKSVIERYSSYIGNTSNKLDYRFNKKIISRDLTITAMPNSVLDKNKNLFGKYSIDAQGIIPLKDHVLIDKGVLKSFMNDRIPTQNEKSSNGHKQWVISNNGIVQDIGPGVIQMTSENTLNNKQIIEKLKSVADEEDLDYVLIVRKVKNNNSGLDKISQSYFSSDTEKKGINLLYVFKYYVKTGKEELVRSIELDRLTISSFKRVLGVTKENITYKTMLNSKEHITVWWRGNPSNLNGMPSTVIVPYAILFEELELQKTKSIIVDTPTIVESPIASE